MKTNLKLLVISGKYLKRDRKVKNSLTENIICLKGEVSIASGKQ